MDTLWAPRLVFSGQFQADPSTVNNDPEHFNSAKFRSNYQLPGPDVVNGWWNPHGTGAWRFRDCRVTQVVYADGTSTDDPNVDSVIGLSLNDADQQVEGKIVDLDSEQQMVSEIWGFQVLLGQSEAGTGFRSDFLVSPFADIWTRYPQGQPDSCFGAFYQSTLRLTDGVHPGDSRFLAELADQTTNGQLSIRFNVDGYDDVSTSPTFKFGRVVGWIRPYSPSEPVHFVAGRALWAVPQLPGNVPAVNTVYGQIETRIDQQILMLDLGNSLPTTSPGGPFADIGRIYAALLPGDQDPVLIEEICYSTPNWYQRTAGIATIALTADQVQQASMTPLGIVQSSSQGIVPILAERSDGSFLRADDFVFRLNPGEEAHTKFYATKFGQRAVGQKISLGYDPTIMQQQTTQGPVPGPQDVGVPKEAFTFPTTITTGEDGTAQLSMKARDPQHPRDYIDGQVYGVSYAEGDTPPSEGSVQNPSAILSALVWSGYTIPQRPTWLRDVRPILEQYANLYPVMMPIVNLANYASLLSRREVLKNVFAAPVEDPNYMPVTRDLSLAKRTMIRQWLDEPLYMELNSVEDLRMALQQALQLEHATIPPYLCALYSIKPGANVEVAELIRSVVIEEMLHMALACNVLISIGGAPKIGQPGFVPRYPGPLPGGLRGGLTVRLRRCSIAQIRDVFMSIEEPSETAESSDGRVGPQDPRFHHQFTIAWFYQEIIRALKELSGSGQITFGHTERQVKDWTGPGQLYVIDSLEKAELSLKEIMEQGEGATPLDPDDTDQELAHYYKFSEIVEGRRIVMEKDGFSYSGPPIPFDPDGVWPMVDDPDIALLPRGSRARILSEEFAHSYQALLNGLHRTFNGNPDNLSQSIGMMYSLATSARQLMQTPSGRDDGTTAGPTFQLPFPL